ncbi:thiamine phosphate synthase [Galbibacter sp. EGI 63066]|uniref:thiamine phosphate synthase n=1 Tax=Galbibacter sp. EGI 63066 TaxID=2993559 RepID=UPI002248F30A|nr:thiamine phosphate synthase [Galbibacter sp. EGI 63066]MCX2678865.1 thiamine phosphate synthase [Galbibacter sp. EGI 63066]
MQNIGLYYISQGETPEEHLLFIEKMAKAGVKWIQLRLKEVSKGIFLETALRAATVCERYGAKLIVNDDVEVAKATDAAGVHLGKEDSCPLIARKLLGAEKIIGGTANTLADCYNLIVNKKVDYIGLGPFRFTTTKKNLSPIMNIEGYREILKALDIQDRSTPMVAIGGITKTDVSALKQAGVQGVAISSFLHQQEDLQQCVDQIQNHFKLQSYAR